MKVIYDAELAEIEKTPCSPTGWLNGEGIFETIRTVHGVAYAYSRHIERAVKSAEIAGISLPDLVRVEESVKALVHAEPHPDGLLRISFDSNGHWAVVHLPYLPTDKAVKVRIHPDSITSHLPVIKRYPYEHRLSILEEAKLLGFDEALVCNDKGFICEGAVTNVIMKIDGRWVTPSVVDGVLPGIIRQLVIENCGVEIESIHISRIKDVESAILLSSLRISQSVASLGGRDLERSEVLRDEIRAMVIVHSLG